MTSSVFGTWRYALVWVPRPEGSSYALWRVAPSGQWWPWLRTDAPACVETPAVQDVLEELYRAVLELQEMTA